MVTLRGWNVKVTGGDFIFGFHPSAARYLLAAQVMADLSKRNFTANSSRAILGAERGSPYISWLTP
ncbi:MAG: hypothetical protein WED81_03115 [Rhodothermales bacterium]